MKTLPLLLQLVRGEACTPGQLADLEQLIDDDPDEYPYAHYLPILHSVGATREFKARNRSIAGGVYRKSFVQYKLLLSEVARVGEVLTRALGEKPFLLDGIAMARRYYPEPAARWSTSNAMLVSGLPSRLPNAIIGSLPGYRLIYDNFECCTLRSDNGCTHILWRSLPDGLLPDSDESISGGNTLDARGMLEASPELQLLLSLRRLGVSAAQAEFELALLDISLLLVEPHCYRAALIKSCIRTMDNGFAISRGVELGSAQLDLGQEQRNILALIVDLLPDHSYHPRPSRLHQRVNNALWSRPRRLSSHPEFSYAIYYTALLGRQMQKLL
jgi:hypothetical protein